MNVNSFLLQVRSTLCSLSQFTPWHRALCHVARTVYLYLFTLLDEEGHCEIEVSHPKNNIMTQFHFGCLLESVLLKVHLLFARADLKKASLIADQGT